MYAFKGENKIDLDSNKTDAITERCSTKQFLFPWCQQFWKWLAKKSICFAELMLEPFDFTKNIFKIILLRFKVFAFSHLEFQEHVLCRTRICDSFWTRAQIEHYDFPSYITKNTSKVILIFRVSFLMSCSWKQYFWAFKVTLPSLK